MVAVLMNYLGFISISLDFFRVCVACPSEVSDSPRTFFSLSPPLFHLGIKIFSSRPSDSIVNHTFWKVQSERVKGKKKKAIAAQNSKIISYVFPYDSLSARKKRLPIRLDAACELVSGPKGLHERILIPGHAFSTGQPKRRWLSHTSARCVEQLMTS